MRILKVVQSYYPFQERGGTAVKVRALARGLARRGHEVTVLTADLGLRQNNRSIPIERCDWGFRACEEGVEAIYLPVFGRYRALTLNPHALDFCRRSLSSFDIVHIYGLYDLLGPIVGHFCRHSQIPYIVEPMGMYRAIDRGFFLKTAWHQLFGSALFRKVAKIIATSEMEERELQQAGLPSARILVRYNGIDPEWFSSPPAKGAFRQKWGIPAGEPYILFLSRLIPRKGADILIEAFAKACGETGRLVIAGPEGERGYQSHLAKCAAQNGVSQRVLFTGPLYDEQKRAAMCDADLFILPSRYENFANAPAEAIACGVPVLISDACGIQSLVINQAGLVVKPETGALIDGLRRLLRDKELYARLKKGCSAVAAGLRWDRLCERMEGCYAAAVAVADKRLEPVVSPVGARS